MGMGWCLHLLFLRFGFFRFLFVGKKERKKGRENVWKHLMEVFSGDGMKGILVGVGKSAVEVRVCGGVVGWGFPVRAGKYC